MDGSLGNEGRGTTIGARAARARIAAVRGSAGSYSYSHSTRVDHPGDERRLFTYDQPHSLNAAASWKGKRWQLGGRFQLYSGLPYTPAIGSVFDSDRNLYIPLYADAEHRARADPSPARPARRLLVAVGTDRADRFARRPERLHERQHRHVLLQLRLHAAARRSSRSRSSRRSACEVCCEPRPASRSRSHSPRAPPTSIEPWQLDHDRIIAVRADAAAHPAGRDSRGSICSSASTRTRRPSARPTSRRWCRR